MPLRCILLSHLIAANSCTGGLQGTMKACARAEAKQKAGWCKSGVQGQQRWFLSSVAGQCSPRALVSYPVDSMQLQPHVNSITLLPACTASLQCAQRQRAHPSKLCAVNEQPSDFLHTLPHSFGHKELLNSAQSMKNPNHRADAPAAAKQDTSTVGDKQGNSSSRSRSSAS